MKVLPLALTISEGHVERNPTVLLYTPRDADRAKCRVMNIEEVQMCFAALDQRERLVVKLAVLAGIRPLRFSLLAGAPQRNPRRYSAKDLPRRDRCPKKTTLSIRHAALPEGVLREIEAWQAVSIVADDDAWVFPSERMTPMSKDNCWNRNMKPKLQKVGLGWANFLVMGRTRSTLMDVSQNVYSQSPVAARLPAINQLEKKLLIMVMEHRWSTHNARLPKLLIFFGAGDRDRTGDIQLGKLTFYH